jgi:hypothetical protein
MKHHALPSSYNLIRLFCFTLSFIVSSTLAQTAPTLHLPSSSISAAVSSTFVIDYTLHENGLTNSVVFHMDPFPGDGKGRRTITFGSNAISSGRHTITITPFDNPQADTTLVSSVTCDVSDCSPSDGAAFLFVFAYTGTEVGDQQATSQTDVLYIDLQTEPISLDQPTSNDITIATGFNVQFTKSEQAFSGSLILTFSRTGGNDDNNGDRVITLSSSLESSTGTSAQISITRLEFLASTSSSVVSVSPATDLVTGTIYTLTVSYRDKANNTPATSSRTGLTFDGETEDPIVYSPTSAVPTFSETFLFHFNLPEEAKPNTLRMKISATNEANGGPIRTVIFATSFDQTGSHQTNFGKLSTISNTNNDIVSVTPAIDLINHQEYVISVAYQDLNGNQESEVLVAPIRFDNQTLPFSVIAPVSGLRLALETEITIVIPENAFSGSVQMVFQPAFSIYGGVDDDSNGNRILVLSSSFETIGTHTFTLKSLATATATTPEVVSVTPATSLVHGSYYDVTVRYRDEAGNDYATVVLTGMECDVDTDPIVSMTPDQTVSGINNGVSYMDDEFTVVFNLPEAAASSSLTLTIEPTGTDRSGTIDYELPRVVTFVDSIGTTSGTKTVAIGQMTTPNTNNVASIVPSANLLDGVIYQFTYSYRDTHGNSATETTITAIRFAGSISQKPTITNPTFGSVLASPFNLTFHLPERPAPNSVKITITPGGGTYADSAAPRVIVFDSSSVVNSGDYTFSITPLSGLADSASYITSVIPNTNLVDGALYAIKLEYQDGKSNPVNSTTRGNVAFAGFETLPLYLHDPRENLTMANAFLLNYTLSETALRGSIQLLLTYVLGNDPVQTTRVIVLSDVMESPGNHYILMQELSTAGGLSAIDSITPASDLIDGTAYDLVFKYQDGASNDPYIVSQPGMYFAGTATMNPIWVSPRGTSSLPAAFIVSYKLPERPTPGSVKLIISRTDGLPDPAGVRVITFANTVEEQNIWHNFSMNALSLLGDTVPQVASCVPDDDMIDGTQYRFTFEYQDFGQNPVSSTGERLDSSVRNCCQVFIDPTPHFYSLIYSPSFISYYSKKFNLLFRPWYFVTNICFTK